VSHSVTQSTSLSAADIDYPSSMQALFVKDFSFFVFVKAYVYSSMSPVINQDIFRIILMC
jgi:hypothetical protein